VTVTARREGLVLRIVVEDDGTGMAAEKLGLLRASLGAEGEDGDSGLRNVQRRIRIAYGEPWGLTLESHPGEGTRVEISVPVASPLPARGAGGLRGSATPST
jgi:two-component system sensor histidine kinase YesM